MTIKSDASLRGKARQLAKTHGLSSQEVMQRYFFERFLLRIEKTEFRSAFILKGGLLLSSLMGVAQRTTMDLDATLRGLRLEEQSLRAVLDHICAVDLKDGVTFSVGKIAPIRDDDAYGGLRVHLTVVYGRMTTPMKMDLTTGDAITPAEVVYPFPLLFDEGVAQVMAYPIETVLAEKYETIVKRGVASTRARDFYDLVMIVQTFGELLDWDSVRRAVQRTAERRGSVEDLRDYEHVSREIESSPQIRLIWDAYVRNNPYASTVTIEQAMDVLRLLGGKIAEGRGARRPLRPSA
ncbi:MAG: nucleotidyl transferase AbiEii/AbiGii toxin family protein [Eggerthellaceae bacterium]|nr:nucleotidyl transferase AbiEii/AbiGii toxin family protein [Eggerthellaceae bacterium]